LIEGCLNQHDLGKASANCPGRALALGWQLKDRFPSHASGKAMNGLISLRWQRALLAGDGQLRLLPGRINTLMCIHASLHKVIAAAAP
jgi:hypothetical protein